MADTARQTQETLGFPLGAGIYVNYAFVALWVADAGWWWLSPATFRSRPVALDRAVRVFILFIFANGAVVFPHGPVRVLGVLVMIALVAAWYRHRLGAPVPGVETMTSAAATESLPRPFGLSRWPLYYGWVNLGVAAAAMVGTLPGRTQGLGLITEPLLRDLRIGRVAFAEINLVATLLGSLFCLGIGRLVDLVGARLVLVAIALGLGSVVLVMSGVTAFVPLLILVTLTRGLGQSACPS